MNKVIRVWACCGAFGWTIPWAKWHAKGIYPQPPDDPEGCRYIFLYSVVGQLSDDKALVGWLGAKPADSRWKSGFIPSICVDDAEYLDREAKRVDWDVVLRAIKDLYAKEAGDADSDAEVG